MTRPLRLFVYGTLKRGGRYHDRYCRGALSIEPGRVSGRIYFAAAGYPVLVVEKSSVLADGSADRDADLAAQTAASAAIVAGESATGDVVGEIVTFDDGETRLAAIDELEGFRPGAASLYGRVLLAARKTDGRLVAAWTYVEGDVLRAARPRSPR